MMGSSSVGPARSWKQRAVLVLLSSVFALVLAELLLRVVVPPRTTHSVWPPNMSRVFHPRADLYADLPGETRFTINRRGLRGAELGADGEELRVLALGGSTTECLYHDDPKAWTNLVSTHLSAGAGKRVWVGSAGRSGMNSGDHVLHAQHLLAELPAMDAVVVFLGVNDMSVALGRPEAYEPTPRDMDQARHEKAVRRAFFQVPGPLEDAWDYDGSIAAKSRLYQLVKRIRRQRSRDLGTIYKMQDDEGEAMLAWRANRKQARRVIEELPDLTTALATFRANVTTIADIAADRGVRLVLMTQPALWRADLTPAEQDRLWMGGVGDFQSGPGHDYYSPAALAEALRRFNAVTLDVCRERGLSCVDLAKVIPRDTTVFYDDCHFGQTGSERIAEATATHLRTLAPFSAR